MPGDSSDRRRRIFISYRRRVGGHSVDLIWERLAKRLGDGLVFYDQHEIVAGEPFPQRLRDALNDCEVVLVVIDPDWVDERYLIGDRQGERRLDDPADWVRIEIETALAGK
jgi:TIR domain